MHLIIYTYITACVLYLSVIVSNYAH